MIHANTKVIPKPTKKRVIMNLNCPNCNSTFDTKYKMKKHIKEEHEDKKRNEHESESPQRKIANKYELNDRINDDDDSMEENSQTNSGGPSPSINTEEDEKDTDIQIKEDESNIQDYEKEKLKEELINTKHHNSQLEEDKKNRDKSIENLNKWISDHIRRTKNLETEMIELSKDNKGRKEELILKENIIEHLNIKMQTLQQKVNEQNAIIEAHGQPTQAQNLDVASSNPLWRPYADLTAQAVQVEKEVDECIQNVQCKGNCTHGACKFKSNIHNVTCHDCKEEFSDKIKMMDHKRDSDHPSKRKCNQFPDCARPRCWYVHPNQVTEESAPRQPQKQLTCTTCQNEFSDKNELMHHKKREHPNNIICKYFLNGNCRRSANNGALCWFRHDQLPTSAPSVVRNPLHLPPPGSPSWNMDFPQYPTMDQSPLVGMQQQIWAILHQQKKQQQQQQQEHQQQMTHMMSQLMNLNM